MKRLSSIFVCIAAVLLANAAAAQTGLLSGKVVDQNGRPVEGATARVTHSTRGGLEYSAETDARGEFAIITGQSAGPWRLSVAKAGFRRHDFPDDVQVPLGGAPAQDLMVTLWEEGAAAGVERQEREYRASKATFEQAARLLDEARKALAAGDQVTRHRKLAEAERAYAALAEKEPEIAEIHFNLAITRKQLERWPEAAASYSRAAEIRPDLFEAYEGAAESYGRAGQIDQAVALLRKGVAAHPESATLQLVLGKVQWIAGQHPDAAKALTKARDLAPTNPEPLYYLGMIAVGQGRTAECVELLEDYLATKPEDEQRAAEAKGLIQALKK